MTKKASRGWYTFEDGYKAWFFRLYGAEKKAEIRKHGRIIYFIHTY